MAVSGNTLAPFTCICYFSENEFFFFFVIQFIAFVLFSPVWPIVHSYPVTTVTEKASFQNAFQSGDFWLRLILVYVWTDENGGFRILYHDVIHHIPRELCMLAPWGSAIVFPSFFKLCGWAKTLNTLRVEAYFSGSGDKVSVFKNTLFFFSIRIYFIRLSRPKFLRF